MLAKDVELPSGATLISDPETLVVAVSVPAAADLGETPEEEAEEGAEAEIAEGDAQEPGAGRLGGC